MYLDDLNPSQKAAVLHEGKHLLLMAGAGTGKTKTIIARVAHLIATGTDPSRIQILTFTKRAANEIVERVKISLESSAAQSLRGATFHSWCNQLIHRFPNLFGTGSFTVIDKDDQISTMKLATGKNAPEYKKTKLKAETLLNIYSFVRNTRKSLAEGIRIKLLSDQDIDAQEDFLETLVPAIRGILTNYDAKKREKSYLDYDDILLVVATRLNNDENARQIVGSLYDHILIDEMQDTNPLQWDLMQPFQETTHLFCVGDDAQSIYAFRGADFKNIHSFQERVADSEVFYLQDNYRSTQEVLDVSNWLLSQSPVNYNKNLTAIRGKGIKPKFLDVNDDFQEAALVADKIEQNYKSGKRYSDNLVLIRFGKQSSKVEGELIRRRIPFVIYGTIGLMDSAHIKDVMSVLRVVNNKDDEIAWIRYLTFWEGIGEVGASKLISLFLSVPYISDCIHIIKSSRYARNPAIAEIVENVKKNRGCVYDAVQAAIKGMGDAMAKKYDKDWTTKRLPDFPVLLEMAKSYATAGELISDLLLDNSTTKSILIRDARDDKSKEDRVIISTIHSAKGLEADTCFVLNVSPGIFPSPWSMKASGDFEEERRVLYVALTRAKNDLYILRNNGSYKPYTSESYDYACEEYFLENMPYYLCDYTLPG
ncbi:MAG: ATP-dependent helicase, partial [Clostridiales bacterium]|nr:ATP-dependent helicase [Clostridiales bacterium]